MHSFSAKRFCPNCYSEYIRKSRRWGIIEKLILPLFQLRPFRCEACGSRFMGFAWGARNVAEPASGATRVDPHSGDAKPPQGRSGPDHPRTNAITEL